MQAQFPIFVREKHTGRLLVCRSVYDLQYHLEQIDIENNEYDFWDSDARIVTVAVQEPIWLRLESTCLDNEGLTEAIRVVSHGGIDDMETLFAKQNYRGLAKKFSAGWQQIKNKNV